jgi:hypothetical protein
MGVTRKQKCGKNAKGKQREKREAGCSRSGLPGQAHQV